MTVVLKDLTWREAEPVLRADPLLLLPLGAALKEHGPHLRLDNDLVLAERLADRVCARADVVRLPAIGWHFYPAFVDYPGSVSLRAETARDLVVDVVGSLARHGARRVYVLNTGLSTKRPLQAAADELAARDITLRFTDLGAALAPVEKDLAEQLRGSHADEVETSMMLHLAPERVEMALAEDEANDRTPGERFVRDSGEQGTLSVSGTWGEPRLASAQKGARFVDAVVTAVLRDLQALAALD
jgi:creatinine amidohydrolase